MRDVALPLPPLARIIPYLFATWNGQKVGSDTMTYLLDLLSLVVPSDEAQAPVVARYMAIMSLIVFRLSQITTRRYEDVMQYNTLHNYRKRASERLTFHMSVLRQIRCIQKMWIPDAGNELLARTPSVPRVSTVPRVSSTRNRQTRESRRVENVAWGSEKTSITPKKRSSKLYEKPINALNSTERRVRQRTERCPGKPIRRESTLAATDPNAKDKGPGSRNNCFECGAFTPWYCLECHHWLCMDASAKFIQQEGVSGRVPLVKIQYADGTIVVGRMSCYIKRHLYAYENMEGWEQGNDSQNPSNLLGQFERNAPIIVFSSIHA